MSKIAINAFKSITGSILTSLNTMPSKSNSVPAHAAGFVDFVNQSPTPFHVVKTASDQLVAAGFVQMSERDEFSFGGLGGEEKGESKLKAGGKYFYTRNQSAILAFTIPRKTTKTSGVSIVAGHTDSPVLKLRPISKKTKGSYLMTGVEVYGGGRFSTWFDRDLSLAGRVIVSTGPSTYTSRLLKIDRPILRIPTLAIHLDADRDMNFKFDRETEMVPILGEFIKTAMNKPVDSASSAMEGEGNVTTPTAKAKDSESTGSGNGMSELERSTSKFSMESWDEASLPPSSAAPSTSGDHTPVSTPTTASTQNSNTTTNTTSPNHHTVMLQAIADELDCEVEDIHDFELSLYDTQKSVIGGIAGEYIYSGKIDNQMTCYCSIQALIDATGKQGLVAESNVEENVQCVALFDNEEVGSRSYQGAESDLLPSFIRRLVDCSVLPVDLSQALANSYLISSDTAHAVHPSYENKHEENLKPTLNGGVVVKYNANQRYTSNAPTSFLFRQIGEKAGVPLQWFEIRNSSPGGSTVGPGLSTQGLRTVDIGIPQLSMHSIREMCGSEGPGHLVKLLSAFHTGFSKIDASLKYD